MIRLVPILVFAAAALSACADRAADAPAAPAADSAAVGPATPNGAVAVIAPTDSAAGGPSGQIEFVETDGAVEIRYNLSGFPGAGPFGFHVHENGSCAPDSAGTPGGAAGGHFNPMASPHGAPDSSATARHAGDLGNLAPEATGRAIGTRVDSVLAFDGPTSILGKAVVIHAGADDFATQPAGDAGGRIACGVVARR